MYWAKIHYQLCDGKPSPHCKVQSTIPTQMKTLSDSFNIVQKLIRHHGI